MNIFALAGLCLLCALTDLKIGDIQPVEIWAFFCLLGCMVLLSQRQWVISGSHTALALLPQYALFFLLVFVGSLLSLRLQFYPPGDFGALKSPPWASFIRYIQVILAVSCMFIVTLIIGSDRRRLNIAMQVYVWAAMISAIWALVSGIAWLNRVELSGAYAIESIRLRGFFVEGGPFGVYLASAIALLCVRRFAFQSVNRAFFALELAILIAALLGSQSKAAILLLLVIGAYLLYLQGNVGLLFVGPLALAPIIATSNLYEGLNGYMTTITGFDHAVRLRPEDASLVMGRVMGTVLLPRMVEQHPWVGIGIGNYSLVRNDPSILQGLPATAQWDLHGLGILGYAAELGIPLTLFALWLYAGPIRLAKGQNCWIGALSAYPLLAALFGVQLNFAYVWIVAGIALSAQAMNPGKVLSGRRVPLVTFRLRSETGQNLKEFQ